MLLESRQVHSFVSGGPLKIRMVNTDLVVYKRQSTNLLKKKIALNPNKHQIFHICNKTLGKDGYSI